MPAPRAGAERFVLRAAARARVPVEWMRDESTGKLGVGGGEPCRHSPCDTAGRLDPRSLRLARRLVESALRAR